MNKKVFVSMLCLSISFILAIYILKIFFPDSFMFYIQNERIIATGQYIDTHRWLYFIVMMVIGISSDYLYFCAVCKKWKISYILWIIMAIYNGALISLYAFAPQIIANYSDIILACSTCYMILTPIFFTKDIKPLAITYCVYYVAQSLSLGIRDLTALLINGNTLTLLLLSLDSYVWSLICCLIFTYKERKNKEDGNNKTIIR